MSSQQIPSTNQAGSFLSNNGSTPVWRRTDWTHAQTIPALVWNINHNLGKKPSVRLEDMNQNTITGVIKDIDNNRLTITFLTEKTGFAYLN